MFSNLIDTSIVDEPPVNLVDGGRNCGALSMRTR